MEEYEILKEVLYIDTIENKSCAHVKFAFRRRIEYHITKTFTQVKLRVKQKSYVDSIHVTRLPILINLKLFEFRP